MQKCPLLTGTDSPSLNQVLYASHKHLSGRSPAPRKLLGPDLYFLAAYLPTHGQVPGGEHLSSCKVEIHLEAAYLLVHAPSSVSMATPPPHHLLLSLPTPPLLFITSLCPIYSHIPSLGTHLLLVSFPSGVIIKSKRASVRLASHSLNLSLLLLVSPAVIRGNVPLPTREE